MTGVQEVLEAPAVLAGRPCPAGPWDQSDPLLQGTPHLLGLPSVLSGRGVPRYLEVPTCPENDGLSLLDNDFLVPEVQRVQQVRQVQEAPWVQV